MPELDIRVTAFIPDSYIESNITRMDAYKEIAEISSLDGEKEFRDSIEDAYGILPEEANNLINIAVVKMLSAKLGVKQVDVNRDGTRLVLADFSVLAGQKIKNALDEFSDVITISMAGEPSLDFDKNGKDNAEMLELLKRFLIIAV